MYFFYLFLNKSNFVSFMGMFHENLSLEHVYTVACSGGFWCDGAAAMPHPKELVFYCHREKYRIIITIGSAIPKYILC